MEFTGEPYVNGKGHLIAGPVRSDKKLRISRYLAKMADSGHKKNGKVLIARHPHDDPEKPEYIDRFPVDKVTVSVKDIYRSIHENTKTVVIAGVSHYQEKSIVDLIDAIIRSNRNALMTGLNVDAQGEPQGYMAELMALADSVELAKGRCFHVECRNDKANRSVKIADEYYASCAHHFHFPSAPPAIHQYAGFLGMDVGSMFSGKTSAEYEHISKWQEDNINFLVLKPLMDNRHGGRKAKLFQKSKTTLHDGRTIRAISVNTVDNIAEYLKAHPRQRDVAIDEGQFIPGLYKLVKEKVAQGYRIRITGLPRGFNRKPFNDIPKLMCIADVVEYHYAMCVDCGHPATDNRRMKYDGDAPMPAHYKDPLELVGGVKGKQKKPFYDPVCLSHWQLPGEPKNPFTLPRYEPQKV